VLVLFPCPLEMFKVGCTSTALCSLLLGTSLLTSTTASTSCANVRGERTSSEAVVPPKRRTSPFGPNANHSMTYRPLGRTGLRVSVISYGAWLTVSESGQVGLQKAVDIIREAVHQGINLIDNAESYGAFTGESEYVVGQALQQLYAEGEVERSDLVITTKLWMGGDGVNDRGLSYKHLYDGLHKSLGRLQTDYVDVLLCHRPDSTTPLEETVRAMNRFIDRGLVLYWGTSEWRADQIIQADGIARSLGLVGPVVEQPLYNLFNRQRVEAEYVGLYSSIGLGLTVYSPLAEGILAGRYSSGKAPEDSRASSIERKKGLADRLEQIDAARKLEPLATKTGCTLPQLVLAWTLRHERVSTAIMGASRPQQVRDNAGAVACMRKLDDAMLGYIEQIAGIPVLASGEETETSARLELVGRGPYH